MVLVMTSPSNPKRCNVCGKDKTALTETIEKKYSPYSDGRVFVCNHCFNLLIKEDYDALDYLVWKKLRGENNATN